MDWFKSERQKWATKIDRSRLPCTPTLPSFDARSRELYDTASPRGVLLRQARGGAQRCDALDAEITDYERRLVALPAVASVDPGAEIWATVLGLSSADPIKRLRIIFMSVMPSCSGLLLSFAMMLRVRR
jgi:hypothetical protein